MNPNAYGSPGQALFATGMGPASFMLADPYGAGPSVTDAYGTPALFAPMPPGPPAAYMYSSSSSSNVANPSDEIRTVFVSGFPHDVKERELHNLLRFMPGYEASQMNWKTGGPQGFALFSSAAYARAVVEMLSGLQFDDGVVVRAEMAHKNMFIKPEDPSVKRASRSSPTLMGPAAIMAPVATQMSGSSLGGPPLSPANPAFLAAAAAAAAATTGSPVHMPNVLSAMPLRPANFSPVTNLRDNPPCNTLFIGNLGDNTSEQELRTLLSSQPGYRQLKMVRGSKSTTAFVEFGDVGTAIMVHSALQGAVLPSSDRGGIRVQFSKNPSTRRPQREPFPYGGESGGMNGALEGLVGGMGNSPRAMTAAGLLGGMPGQVGGQMQPGQMAAGMAAASGSFIGQAGLDTVLGTSEA
ncbi:hypothetical protein COO60DRAFT_1691111 [Scenedesmus sp. NREL 46B-D3]|nr:hypothetical protein COO60DRAFT_1691111 [Scenedesmus sp. NREL 46B-D3]